MTCQARAGLLILRECGQPAAGSCSGCGKTICGLHMMDGQCPLCALAAGRRGSALEEEETRSSYYKTYGTPSQYGDEHYFSEHDEDTLAAPAAAAIAGRRPYDPYET